MIFHDLAELKAYIDRMVSLGLGHARPMLDRRGCDCGPGQFRSATQATVSG